MTTRTKFLVMFAGIGIAIVSFVIGRWRGAVSESEKLMQEEMSRYEKFASMDRAVLQTFPVQSNTMLSGTYLMQVWFPKSQVGTQEVILHCENGQISVPAPNTFSRSQSAQMLSVTGNVVSWTQEGAGYEANPKYVGLVDGDEMWGRIYGWGPGDESVGLWRIYPKPNKSGQPDRAANGSELIRLGINSTSSAATSRRTP